MFSLKLIHFENVRVLVHDKLSSRIANLEKKTKCDKIMICQVDGAHEDPNIKLRMRSIPTAGINFSSSGGAGRFHMFPIATT